MPCAKPLGQRRTSQIAWVSVTQQHLEMWVKSLSELQQDRTNAKAQQIDLRVERRRLSVFALEKIPRLAPIL